MPVRRSNHSPQVIGDTASDRMYVMADDEFYAPPNSVGADLSRAPGRSWTRTEEPKR